MSGVRYSLRVANSFVITTATNTVLLGGDRYGEAAFTVTNQTARAIRARSSLIALDPTQAPWLTLAGTAERDYPPGGTEQVSVAVAIPQGVPAGRYSFRLDVVSVVLPDEDWAQGPVVAMEVPVSTEPVEPPPPEPAGYLETLLGAYAGGLALGAIGASLGLFVLLSETGTTDIVAAIAAAFITAIVAIIFAFVLGIIGMWIGSAVGAAVALRIRGFKDPWRTTVPLAFLFPVWAVLVFSIITSIMTSLDIDNGVVVIMALLLAAILAITLPALGGRAWARWRTTGGL